MKLYHHSISNNFTILILLLVVLAVQVHVGETYSCDTTYFSALVQLLPCQTAVAPFGSLPPTESCCASLQALGQQCMCLIANGPPIAGVDRTMTLQLPQKCAANFEPCQLFKWRN